MKSPKSSTFRITNTINSNINNNKSTFPSFNSPTNTQDNNNQSSIPYSSDSRILPKNQNLTEAIFSLFSKKLYGEIYYAWCKDCNEVPSLEGAKFFRDELLSRNNKDLFSFNFHSMRAGKNFLSGFVANMPPVHVKKADLSDNLLNDECMHIIKNLISAKMIMVLNLASNQISTEGLKIMQNEIIESKFLKYLNLGVYKGSYRINNFSGEGGMIIARIVLNNKSIETLILQENLLGEESGTKIGIALLQNKHLKKLVISNNKIKNKGAKAILENSKNLISLDLSYNEISPDICYDLKYLMQKSKNLKEIIWNGNNVELKGINFIVDGLNNKNIKLKSLCLRNTSLTEEALKTLAKGLINNECLKILDIGANNINQSSFKDLCDALNKTKIKIFRCKGNNLGDECAKYFSETILNKETNSVINSFDFSSCKIYDQGLIYLLHALVDNDKISWINLRDNFFSHEIDFVILNFLEKNSFITHIDLTKNRFSFQCLQKVNKIIKRNRNIQNNKESNKLLVELYSLKYENTKLNELKETLKIIENDYAKLKLNKIDLRADFEISKKEASEKMASLNKQIEADVKLLSLREKELQNKEKLLEQKKLENKSKLDSLKEKLGNIIKEKEKVKEDTQKIKDDNEKLQEEMTKKIVELNDGIELNTKKEADIMKEINEVTNKVIDVENKIKKRKEELKARGYEFKDEEKEKEKKKKEEEKEKKKEEEKSGIDNLILNLGLNKPINEEIKENKKKQNKRKESKKKKKKGK